MVQGHMEKGLIGGQCMDERGSFTSPQPVRGFGHGAHRPLPGVLAASDNQIFYSNSKGRAKMRATNPHELGKGARH